MHEVEIAILEELREVAAGAISKEGNFSRVGIAANHVSQTPEVSILPFHRSSLPSILESGRSSSVTRGQCPLRGRQQSANTSRRLITDAYPIADNSIGRYHLVRPSRKPVRDGEARQ